MLKAMVFMIYWFSMSLLLLFKIKIESMKYIRSPNFKCLWIASLYLAVCLYAPILGIVPTQHFKLSMSAPISAVNCTIQWNRLRYKQYKIHHRVHISVEAKAVKCIEATIGIICQLQVTITTLLQNGIQFREVHRVGITFQKFANAHMLGSLSSPKIKY